MIIWLRYTYVKQFLWGFVRVHVWRCVKGVWGVCEGHVRVCEGCVRVCEGCVRGMWGCVRGVWGVCEGVWGVCESMWEVSESMWEVCEWCGSVWVVWRVGVKVVWECAKVVWGACEGTCQCVWLWVLECLYRKNQITLLSIVLSIMSDSAEGVPPLIFVYESPKVRSSFYLHNGYHVSNKSSFHSVLIRACSTHHWLNSI